MTDITLDILLRMGADWLIQKARKIGDNKRVILSYFLVFLLGWSVGLFAFGWWLTPVSYTGLNYSHLEYSYQEQLVVVVSEWNSYTRAKDKTKAMLYWWGGDQIACDLAYRIEDNATRQRLVAAAYAANDYGCQEGTIELQP